VEVGVVPLALAQVRSVEPVLFLLVGFAQVP